MGFEEFEKHSGSGGNSQPTISLRKTASIGVNGKAYQEYFGEEEDGAVLYYNEEENQIGIKPADSDEENAYTLQFSTSGKGASLNAAGFLKQYGIVPDQTTRYTAHWNDEESLIYIDLDETGTVYGNTDEE